PHRITTTPRKGDLWLYDHQFQWPPRGHIGLRPEPVRRHPSPNTTGFNGLRTATSHYDQLRVDDEGTLFVRELQWPPYGHIALPPGSAAQAAAGPSHVSMASVRLHRITTWVV